MLEEKLHESLVQLGASGIRRCGERLAIFFSRVLEEPEREKAYRLAAEIYPSFRPRLICNAYCKPPPLKKLVFIGSGKGGAGKSTITAQFAHYLAAKKKVRVGVIDADPHHPCMCRMLGIEAREVFEVKDKIQPVKKGLISLLSLGLWLQGDEAVVWSSEMAVSLLQQFLHQGDWSECDVLLIDMPAGTGEVASFLFQMGWGSVVVVSGAGTTVVHEGVGRFVKMAQAFALPILGSVANRWFPTESLYRRRKHNYNFEVPHDDKLAHACDRGRRHPSRSMNKMFAALWEDLCRQES